MDFNDCPHVAFLKVIYYYCSFSYVAVVAKVVFWQISSFPEAFLLP